MEKVLDELENLIWYRSGDVCDYKISIYKDREDLDDPFLEFRFRYSFGDKEDEGGCLCCSCRYKAYEEIHPIESDYFCYKYNGRRSKNECYKIKCDLHSDN